MRVHSIEIENITSLKGKHLIDFKGGLHGEELFAITGPTGAGKSSLLSAISLALYGKTYKGSLASNDFVTTGMPHASVLLHFTLAGKDYQAKWHIKVLKKNGEPIKAPKPNRELICEGVALEQVSIADILGLDFDQFCKTIILNQGEFAKFLHSSFKERKDIIEKLYRTQELSLITKILKEKVKHEEAELKLKTLSFEKALPFTDEEIASIQEDLKEKNKTLLIHEELSSHFNPAYEALTQLYTKLKEERDYQKKIELSNSNLESLTENWNKGKLELDKAKKDYNNTNEKNDREVPRLRKAIEFKSGLDHALKALQQLKKEQQLKSEKKEEITNDISYRSEKNVELEKALKELFSSYNLKELFQKKTKNEIYAFKEDINKLKQHLKELERVQTQKEIADKQLAQQNSLDKKLSKKLDEISSKTDLPTESLEATLLEQRRGREANLTLWSKFETSADNLAQNLKKHNHEAEQISGLEKEILEITGILNSLLEKEKSQNLAKAVLACHEEALSEDECPVCHSTDLSNLVKPVIESELDTKELDQVKSQVNKSQFQLENCKKAMASYKAEAEEVLNSLEKKKNIIFSDYKDKLEWSTEPEVKQGIKILKELFHSNQKKSLDKQEEMAALFNELEQTKKEKTTSDSILEELSKNQESLLTETNRVNSLIDTFLNNWKNIFPKELKPNEVVISFEKDNDIFNDYLQTDQKFTANKEAIDSLKLQNEEIAQRLEVIQSESKELMKSSEALKKQVEDICQEQNPIELLEKLETQLKKDLAALQAASDSHNKTEKQKSSEEQSLRIFNEQVVSLQNLQKTYIVKLKESFKALNNFEEKIPDSYPLAEDCADIIKASSKWVEIPETGVLNELLPILETRLETTWTKLIDQLKDVSLDLKTSVQTNKTRIEDYNSKLKDRAGIEKELELAKKSLLIKNRLLEVFGKDEFRSYALGLLEQELVLGANQELNELCDGRYQLSLLPGKGGQMEFFVLDQWRESTLRKINTLSGGETFLVSLAMALALAELTRGQNEIDSFFIDEGFGHLDVDSIDEVLEVLMNIQNRGKQIGIISHVRALTDRIPVNLTLQKSSLGESRAEFVYN